MIIFFVVLLALIMGSFASCASYRLAENLPLVFTRSKCPKCLKPLSARNLVPLFSFLLQLGKCSNCQQKISWRYPTIELTFVIAFLAIYFVFDNDTSFTLITIAGISTVLIIMSIIDIEKYFIPNQLQFILAILAIILSLLNGGNIALAKNIEAAFLFLAFGGLLYFFFYFVAKVEAIGSDDIKLLFIFGLMLGISKFLVFILITGIIGIIFGALWKKIKKDETFPFAPALCSSAFICLLMDRKFALVDAIASILFLQSF